ncbi:DUF2809 domain-containing protein [Archangium minus]|uniref:DUF2809 domain-containing protein n=1 Tax=Archangium minus TaxID=83450 RepID=A0ABY9WWR7_9BACT|nr:DUF2809 domain-containing protein [Archangium minus]
MQQRLDGFRRFHLAAGCAFLLAGLFVLFYRGPGWRFTRGTLGDLFVVGFLYHLLSLFWRGPAAARAGAIGVLAVGIELAQWARIFTTRASAPLVIVTGSTFDAWDLLVYAIGLTLSVLLEWRWRKRGF